MKPALLPSTMAASPPASPRKSGTGRRPGLLHRLQLTLVALGIVLPATIYLAALLGLAAAAWTLITQGDALASLIPSATAATALRGLLLTGVLLGFLLLTKGLWRIERRTELALPVNRLREPDLYGFVDYLAEAVDAPKPVRIDVNCGAEIAVCFDGGIRGLLSNRLVVRLGLAPVAALTNRDLAALLSCALAPFSAGTGARRAWFITAANDALSRSTAGDDYVDRWLAAHAGSGPLAPLARGLLEFSRRARRESKWLQHWVARISAGTLEQRRAYARRCAELAGGEITAGRLPTVRPLLRSAAVRTAATARQSWIRDGHLPDNLPAETARLFRGHGRAPRIEEDALIRCPTPGTLLLRDFHRTARKLTLLCYRIQLRLPVSGDRLGATSPGRIGERTALDNFFLGCFAPLLPLGLGERPQVSVEEARQTVQQSAAKMAEATRRYREIDRELVTTLQVEALLGAEVPVDPRHYGLDLQGLDAVHERCRYLEDRLEWFADRVGSFQRLIAGRLRQAVDKEIGSGNPRPEDRRMLEVLVRTDRLIPMLSELRSHLLLLEILLAERIERSGAALEDRIRERSDDILHLLKGIRVALRNIPYPVGSPPLRRHLQNHIMRSRPEELLSPAERLEAGQELLERLLGLRRAALERIVVLASSLERRRNPEPAWTTNEAPTDCPDRSLP